MAISIVVLVGIIGEDEARWMIKNELTTEKKIPDFVNYIYADGLKTVKPEAVNIIHRENRP
jgi:NitT/TauT family transport system substrate-binding protein